MANAEHAMLAYAELSAISAERRQALGRDRFLLLAAAAACQAGWPDVAQECRSILSRTNPRLTLLRFGTVADALRDPAFQHLIALREQACPFEKAEHLLRLAGSVVPLPTGEETAGEIAARALQRVTARITTTDPARADDSSED